VRAKRTTILSCGWTSPFEPVGSWQGLCVCKYIFLNVGQLQPGLNGWFPQGERDHLACLRGRNGSGIYIMKVMYPPVGQCGGYAVFERVIPMPGQAG
jgi:hypothetical protein